MRCIQNPLNRGWSPNILLRKVSEIDPLLASSLERVTEDIDSVVSTIVRRGGGSGGGSGAARSVGSRVSKRSGVGSSRGAGRTARR